MRVYEDLGILAFFWLALRSLTLISGFYMNYNKEAKSLSFRRGSEVSQGMFRVYGLPSGIRASRVFRICVPEYGTLLHFFFCLGSLV